MGHGNRHSPSPLKPQEPVDRFSSIVTVCRGPARLDGWPSKLGIGGDEMSMNTRDAQALTYLAGRLRTETPGAGVWDEPGTYAVVSRLVGQNLAMAVEQVTRNAADPDARTPGAINRPFTPALKPQPKVHPPRREAECRIHAGQYGDNCGGCAADRRAVVFDDELEPAPNLSRDQALAAARADLARAKTQEEAP